MITAAALFSRDVSQLLIAFMSLVTAVGIPLVSVILHKNTAKTEEIKIVLNGRVDNLLARVDTLAARVEGSLPESAV